MNKDKSRADQSSVLVVSGDHSTAKLIKVCFSLEGIHADVSSDGMDAMEKVNEKEYRLVLTDIVLPKMDGNNLCREIKQRQIELPVMGIAAVPSKAVAPFERVHKKPFRVKELTQSAHELMA